MWHKRTGKARRRAGWLREGPKLEIVKGFLYDGRYKVFATGVWTRCFIQRQMPCWDGEVKWKVYLSDENGYTTFDDYASDV